jgi:glycosyltransferase involved in cell wall biosynthesis
MTWRKVCMVGIFPPPLHGMSAINLFIKKNLCKQGYPIIINFSPGGLNKGFFNRIIKIPIFLIQFINLIINFLLLRIGPVYFGLSGGYGQIYDCFFVLITRIFCRDIYLHHHSYQYINEKKYISKVLFALVGRSAIHIVACEKMRNDLKDKYSLVTKVKVISGIATLENWGHHGPIKNNIITIGFLSNISEEKGIFIFLKIAEFFLAKNLPINFLVAGPYQDDIVRHRVEKLLSKLANTHYVGSKYGNEKKHFYDSLDIFLFPTQYVNESEGLVIHEAMSRSVPVIAYSRGCIPQFISDDVGMAIDPKMDFYSQALVRIQSWLSNLTEYQQISKRARRQFEIQQSVHAERINELCAELNSKVAKLIV